MTPREQESNRGSAGRQHEEGAWASWLMVRITDCDNPGGDDSSCDA